MRIVAGRLRGRRIPSARCLDPVRLTAAPLKEAVFSMLGGTLEGLSFLDLCAGSAQIGLEAHSRGATVVINEPDERRWRQIRSLLRDWRERGVELHRTKAQALLPALAASARRFDVVYLDPPYHAKYCGGALSVALLHQVGASPILNPDALVLVQHQAQLDLPQATGSLSLHRRRVYGNTHLSMYLHGGTVPAPPAAAVASAHPSAAESSRR